MKMKITEEILWKESIFDIEGNLFIPDGVNNFIFDVLNGETNLTLEDEE